MFSFFEKFSARERALFLLMIGFFGIAGAYMLLKSLGGSGGDLDAEIDSYRQALSALAMAQSDIQERIEQSHRLEELLTNNSVQLHTFLERQCLETNVARPTQYSDNEVPLRGEGGVGEGIWERQTVADIASVSPLNLSSLLNRIATTEEFVLLKAIEIRPSRTGGDTYRVRITVATYERRDGDS
jgi:hypothetical protein